MNRASALAAVLGVAVNVLGGAPAFAQEKPPAAVSQVCAACHAADGNSTAPANPKLAGQVAEYLEKQLRDFKPEPDKKPRRESAVMNAMVANLSDKDFQALASYFASQALKPAAALDKALAAQGQKLWRGGDAAAGVPACAGCHGPSGAGIPSEFPRLGGQYAEYVAAQLQGFRSGSRANDPSGMMRGVASHLTDAQIRALAEYVAGLR
ncbi:MAG TPA: c-type cytochrome [Burkholderiales bacterium]|nr:c-type cytochrome [Burkholderiales bacterium]